LSDRTGRHGDGDLATACFAQCRPDSLNVALVSDQRTGVERETVGGACKWDSPGETFFIRRWLQTEAIEFDADSLHHVVAHSTMSGVEVVEDVIQAFGSAIATGGFGEVCADRPNFPGTNGFLGCLGNIFWNRHRYALRLHINSLLPRPACSGDCGCSWNTAVRMGRDDARR
jgi:hypothetical protein